MEGKVDAEDSVEKVCGKDWVQSRPPPSRSLLRLTDGDSAKPQLFVVIGGTRLNPARWSRIHHLQGTLMRSRSGSRGGEKSLLRTF